MNLKSRHGISFFTIALVGFVLFSIVSLSTLYELNQMIVDLLTIATTVFGAFFIWLEFKRAKDIDEANFIVSLNSEFNDSQSISRAYEIIKRGSFEQHKAFVLADDIQSRNELNYISEEDNKILVSYFTFFETLNLLLKRKVTDLSVLDELFAVRFFTGANNPIIQDMKIATYKYSYTNIFELHEKWRDYRIENGKRGRDKEFCLSHYYDILGGKYELRRMRPVHIDEIMVLQDRVYDELLDKSHFIKSPKNRFLSIFSDLENLCLGIYKKDTNALIGYANLVTSDYSSEKYYKSEFFDGIDRKQVMYFRTIFVDPAERGNGIQNYMTNYFIKHCIYHGYKAIVLTVHPNNRFSKRNFQKSKFNVINQIDQDSEYIRDVMAIRVSI